MVDSGAPQIFISYAWKDGRSTMELLRRRLPSLRPGCQVWTDDLIDPRERTFTLPIQRALERSAAALFVITEASRESDWCETEILYARTLQLPCAVIRPRSDVVPPFSLGGSSMPIELAEDDEAGWQRLGRFLNSIGTPTVRATLIADEHARVDAAAALAADVDRERFAVRGNELATTLSREQERLADPAAAGRRMRQRIEADLVIEREPAPDPAAGPVRIAAGVRLINDLPGLPPLRFHDRDDQLQRLKLLLAGSVVRLIALTGRDGMGKTALLTRLRDFVGSDGLDRYRAIVFLDACGHQRVTTAALLTGLAGALDEPSATEMRERLGEAVPSVDRLVTVLEMLAEQAVLVVVDGADELLDDRGEFRDPDLREVCYELAVREGHDVRVLFVGQRLPEPLLREVGERGAEVPLDCGLPMPEAGDFVRMLDSSNLLGDAGRDEDFLSRLCAVTGGRPRSLEMFYGILRAEPYTKPMQLLTDLENVGAADEALFNRMLNDLLDVELRVVEALAVYGRPVVPGAVDYLLADVIEGVEAAEPLRQLEGRRVVRRDGERYYLPPRDAERVTGRIERIAPLMLTALRRRAADFHHESRTPPERVHQVADLDGHLNELEMRVRAGEYNTAAIIMADLDERYLRRWGHSALILPLRYEVSPHLTDSRDRILNLSMAAAARSQQERYDAAAADLRAALRLAHRGRALPHAVALWRQLGSIEQRAGGLSRANRLFRRALTGCVALGMQEEEARCRLNLGLVLARTGRYPAALRQITTASSSAFDRSFI